MAHADVAPGLLGVFCVGDTAAALQQRLLYMVLLADDSGQRAGGECAFPRDSLVGTAVLIA